MTDGQRWWAALVIGAVTLVAVIVGSVVAAALRAAGP